MDNIYEVERDDYVGFIGQLRSDCRNTHVEQNEGVTWYKTYSKKYGNLLCVREIYEDGDEHYYVFDMPQDDERQAAKPVRKINLESREEVQAFFDFLSQLDKEKK